MWFKKQNKNITSKAIAYYRHSAQDRQENSTPIQREQVRQFASENGIEIIKEFADHGKSGLSTEGRDNFKRMLEMVIDTNIKFKYIDGWLAASTTTQSKIQVWHQTFEEENAAYTLTSILPGTGQQATNTK